MQILYVVQNVLGGDFLLGVLGFETKVRHSADKETVGIFLGYLHQVIVLETVDNFLNHNRSANLCIIHIGDENFGGVPAVGDKRRQHLHFLPEKHRAAACGGVDALSIHNGILFEPKVAVCVYYVHYQCVYSVTPVLKIAISR